MHVAKSTACLVCLFVEASPTHPRGVGCVQVYKLSASTALFYKLHLSLCVSPWIEPVKEPLKLVFMTGFCSTSFCHFCFVLADPMKHFFGVRRIGMEIVTLCFGAWIVHLEGGVSCVEVVTLDTCGL